MKSSVLIFFLIISSLATAQENSIVFHTGLGTYSMKSQKQLQNDFRKYGIPYKAVHEFPPYITLGVDIGFKVGMKTAAGVWYEYTSTGGRLSYEDYSGMAQLDQLLHCSQIGGFVKTQINRSDEWQLFATAHFSAIFTNGEIRSKLMIGSVYGESDQLALHSFEVGIRPGLMIQRKIRRLIIQGQLGYEIQYHLPMKTAEGYTIYTLNDQPVKAQWDGIRASIGIGIPFKFKSKI